MILLTLQRHLVDDWRHVWKYGSARWSAVGVAINVYGAIALKGAAAATSVLGLLTMRQALLVGAAVSAAALIARYHRKPSPAITPTVPAPK